MGGHDVRRNLSEPSDQTLLYIDVYADYLRTIRPQTPSRALSALLTRGGGKPIDIDNIHTEACILNIDGINIYTKPMMTCDEDLA